jgi:hypothetical protein
MLQAHSLLWHYLWIAPNVLLIALGLLIWKRGLARQFPTFCAFAILSSLGHLALWFADVVPSVSAENFWRVYWASLLVEGVLKLALVAEIFALTFGSYSALARLGKILIRAVGVVLVFTATLAAAYAPQDSRFGIISGAHLLEQTICFIETGLLLFIFLFAAYFKLRPARPVFGIALGLAISACVHLASWAITANGGLPDSKRMVLDFFKMAVYHACVLVWFYYLLIPHRVVATLAVPLPENNLAVWNRELERLLQQ